MWLNAGLAVAVIGMASYCSARVLRRVHSEFRAALTGRLYALALGPLAVVIRYGSLVAGIRFTGAMLFAVLVWTKAAPERLFPGRWFGAEPAPDWRPIWTFPLIIATEAALGWWLVNGPSL